MTVLGYPLDRCHLVGAGGRGEESNNAVVSLVFTQLQPDPDHLDCHSNSHKDGEKGVRTDAASQSHPGPRAEGTISGVSASTPIVVQEVKPKCHSCLRCDVFASF